MQKAPLLNRISLLLGIMLTMWAVFIVNTHFLQGSLNYYGIQPWSVTGLRGILFSPFLHGNVIHISANSLSFLLFGFLIVAKSRRDFFRVTWMAMLVGGLGVWLTGSPGSMHIGASGVIFGYFGFLLTYGWYAKKFWYFVLSLILGFAFGGMLMGLSPFQAGQVSWQGHLFGFIGGICAARELAWEGR